MAEDFITYEGYYVPKEMADQLGLEDEGAPITNYDEDIKEIMGLFFNCPFSVIKSKLGGVVSSFYSNEVEFRYSFSACTSGYGPRVEFVDFMKSALIANPDDVKKCDELERDLEKFFEVYCTLQEKKEKVKYCEEQLYLCEKEQAYLKDKEEIDRIILQDEKLQEIDKEMDEISDSQSTIRSWQAQKRYELEMDLLRKEYHKRYQELKQELLNSDEDKREQLEGDVAFAECSLERCEKELAEIREHFTETYMPQGRSIR